MPDIGYLIFYALHNIQSLLFMMTRPVYCSQFGVSAIHSLVNCCRAQTLMKARLKGAQKGHSLLKKKSDALTTRFRAILKQIVQVIALILAYVG